MLYHEAIFHCATPTLEFSISNGEAHAGDKQWGALVSISSGATLIRVPHLTKFSQACIKLSVNLHGEKITIRM